MGVPEALASLDKKLCHGVFSGDLVVVFDQGVFTHFRSQTPLPPASCGRQYENDI